MPVLEVWSSFTFPFHFLNASISDVRRVSVFLSNAQSCLFGFACLHGFRETTATALLELNDKLAVVGLENVAFLKSNHDNLKQTQVTITSETWSWVVVTWKAISHNGSHTRFSQIIYSIQIDVLFCVTLISDIISSTAKLNYKFVVIS